MVDLAGRRLGRDDHELMGARQLPRRRALRTALFAVVALACAVALAACTSRTTGIGSPTTPTDPETSLQPLASPTLSSATPTPTPTTSAPGAPVHVSSLESDHGTYGVGMPIVVYFNKTITDAKPFAQAVVVTVNGEPAQGAWYFETSARAGEKIEAHYRLKTFWPGHVSVHVGLPLAGISAGTGLAFQNSLTLDFSIGAAHVMTVNGATHELTVTTDGVLYGRFPVSLGASRTPTLLGTKVISEKDRNERMVGSGYDEIVPWSMRITQSGEYLHAASWNVVNIGHYNTSNGCTNLLPSDAEKLWNYLQVGDPVTYANTGGSKVTPQWDGYGDWNVPWTTWLAGGSLPTS